MAQAAIGLMENTAMNTLLSRACSALLLCLVARPAQATPPGELALGLGRGLVINGLAAIGYIENTRIPTVELGYYNLSWPEWTAQWPDRGEEELWGVGLEVGHMVSSVPFETRAVHMHLSASYSGTAGVGNSAMLGASGSVGLIVHSGFSPLPLELIAEYSPGVLLLPRPTLIPVNFGLALYWYL